MLNATRPPLPRFRPCPVDGTPVDTLSARRGPAPVYCSAACRQRAFRARRKTERLAVVAEAESIVRDAADPIPEALRERPRWVRWILTRDGRKIPLRADRNRAASSTDPSTWCDYATARDSTIGDGVGFVLGDGIGCLDLDDALDASGAVQSAIAATVLRDNPRAWIERSMSGRGLHVLGLLAEAPGRRRRGVEVYSRARFIAMTADVFRDGSITALRLPSSA